MYTTFQGLKQQTEGTKHATINPHEILKQLHLHTIYVFACMMYMCVCECGRLNNTERQQQEQK